MAIYVVTRKIVIHETVLVKADSVYDAFMKAGEDVDCELKAESEGDYEPDYQSIAEVPYLSSKE